MTSWVVDTNVPVVANGRADQASPACVINCIARLSEVRTRGKVVLDEGMLILNEYMSNLSMSGQPGAGDYFMKWVWDNQGMPECCERVTITPRADSPEDFAEFPEDARLNGFDRADRKFVAVALSAPTRPTVLNATDADWWNYRTPLVEHGVRIEFLCPDQFEGRGRRS